MLGPMASGEALSVAAPHERAGRAWITGFDLLVLFAANLVLVVGLWWRGGELADLRPLGQLLTTSGRLAGLIGAYLILVQVLLLARIPALERAVGFDRLTGWHRRNG